MCPARGGVTYRSPRHRSDADGDLSDVHLRGKLAGQRAYWLGTRPDASGHEWTALFLVCSTKGDTGRPQDGSGARPDQAQLRPCRAAPVRSVPRRLHRPGRPALPSPGHLRRQGRCDRLALHASRRDRDGRVGARGRRARRPASGVPDLPGVRRPLAQGPQDQGSGAARHDSPAVPDAARDVHLPDVRRRADRQDHQRGRQRLVRRPGSGARDDPSTVLQPAAHDLRQRGLGAAHAARPVQPGPHPRAGSTKRAHHVQPASLEELRIIVEELPVATS